MLKGRQPAVGGVGRRAGAEPRKKRDEAPMCPLSLVSGSSATGQGFSGHNQSNWPSPNSCRTLKRKPSRIRNVLHCTSKADPGTEYSVGFRGRGTFLVLRRPVLYGVWPEAPIQGL